MIRALIFDFNGVLVDDEALHFELFQRVFEEENIDLSSDDYYQKYVGCDDEGCFRLVFEASGRSLEPVHLMRLIARKSSYYQSRIDEVGFEFFPGAVELVREAARSLTLAVVSGALRQEIESALAQEALRPLFKTIVAAEDVREGKPDPEGYIRALNELNSESPLPERLFHPHEVLAIEDTMPGLQAASAAGLVTLGVGHTFSVDELVAADARVESLAGMDVASLQRRFEDFSRS